MIKILRLVLFFTTLSGMTSICYAQFPYMESFRNASAPGIEVNGSPSAFLTAAGSGYSNGQHTGTPIDPNGGGYLRLTSNATYQKGYAISDATFLSTGGLSAEFEYYIYGGTGADGISFFLFDATANPFVIGSFGGSLGYAQTTNPILTPGVSKGYLAVGLDEYGNFSNAIEGRQGGTTPIGELRPGSVTLRGKGDGDALTPDNYKFLTTAWETINFPFPLVGNGAMRTPNPTDEGYRKVLMLMEPNPLGGYNITVKLTKGGSPGLTVTVIDKFHYPEAAPAILRYGFASSTGSQTNYHEVRNVTIDVLNPIIKIPPVATNDLASACQFNQAVINVAGNDLPSAEGGAIDKTKIDLDPNTAGIQNSLNVPDVGVFSTTADGFVQFTPVNAFVGTASCSYNIQDVSGTVSNNATIAINYSAAPAQPFAGPDQLVNVPPAPAAADLQATNPGANTGKWAQVSGPNTAAFVSESTFKTTATNLTGGTYVFRWTVKSPGGCELSDDVQVIVNRRPVAADDAISTKLNTDIPIYILDNDTDADGNTTIMRNSISILNAPQNGALVIDNVTGIVTYKPKNGFTGYDSFVYTVKDIYGAESNTAIAKVAVNIVIPAPNINTDATSGEPRIIDVPIPPGGTVMITTPPKHGTITFDPVTGKPIYTPNSGYTGPDDFVYIVKDADGNQSNPGTVTITVNPALNPARIGLAKAMTKSTKNVDGSYELAYTFTLVNAGDIDINRLSLSDDLSSTFPGATIKIKGLVALGSLIINSDYNGTSDKEILSNASILKATSKELIELVITITLGDKGGVFENTAFVTGFSVKTGLITDDQSTDGFNPDSQTTGDFTSNDPTPVTLTKDNIFIPGGFSPNNDGINDLFVIENTLGRQMNLEIYNRWGNRIYKAKSYQNTWNGKTTEGIHVGDDAPAGTYYYILTIDNQDKRVGYITINR